MTAISRPFPVWLSRSRAWLSMLLLLPAAMGAIFSAPMIPIDSWGDLACDSLGWCLFITGAVFRWWATLYIGGRKDMQLISHGPYSICRNPLYFGTFLLTISVGVLSHSLLFVAAVALVSTFYLGITVPVEEQRLLANHGEAYRKYLERVPRFFPRFWLHQSPERIEVNVAGLRAELVRMLRWVWIPLLCQALTHFRTQDWWPHWATLP